MYTFAGTPDGAYPTNSGVVQDEQGNLYGTTWLGGNSGNGTVFKVDTSGHETVIHNFAGRPDGANPLAGLVYAGGMLYGTTYGGGAVGPGTVFKMDTSGNETILYSFLGGPSGDAMFPDGSGVVLDALGNLYGTTRAGGAHGAGAVFEVDGKTLQETVLHSFTGNADGGVPYAGVVLDAARGNLYGTTSSGGDLSACGGDGCGTVYKIDTSGNNFTVLHTFTGNSDDGANSEGGLALDSEGNLYGTSVWGGVYGAGTVFKLDTSNNLTLLHSFAGTPDGNAPYSAPLLDGQGNLYGTTIFGGYECSYSSNGYGCGTVFKLDAAGNETLIHVFGKSPGDGLGPNGVALDSEGNLYGTTGESASGYGTVFKLIPTAATTTTALTSAPNPSLYGQSVTFVAKVASGAQTPPDGETVSFMNGATALGSGTLNDGSASFVTSFLPVGTASITAIYGGDSQFAESTSPAVAQVVSPAVSTVTANNASRLVGAANPAFSVTYSGFVNGDTAAVLSGSPAFSTTASSSSPAGLYPITVTQGTLSAANYSFSFVNGTLSVIQAPPVAITITATLGSASISPPCNGPYCPPYGIGFYEATVTVTNNGTGPANNVQLTSATLGAATGFALVGGTLYPLPVNLGNLAPNGGSATAAIYFNPLAVGIGGAAVAEKYSGTYTGGSFSTSIRSVTLP